MPQTEHNIRSNPFSFSVSDVTQPECKLYSIINSNNIDDPPPIPHYFKHFAIAHFNVRDIQANVRFDELQRTLSLFPFQLDVVSISETWCTPNSERLFGIEGYSCIAASRRTRKGGGVFMYINELLDIRNINTYSNETETLQLAACTIRAHNRVILVITIYNAEGNLDEFKLALDNILSKYPSKVMTILAGDINIDISKRTSLSSEYLAYTGSHGFVPLINAITRPGKVGSCIDHILARNHEDVLNSLHGVVDLLTPDHRPIFSAFTGWGQPKGNHPIAKRSEKFRNFTRRNHTTFLAELNDVSWLRILRHEDAQSNFTAYVTKMNEIYNKSFPLCDKLPKTKCKPHSDAWFDDELIQLRGLKDRLANKVKRFAVEADRKKLRQLSTQYNKLCKSKRKNYLESKFANANVKEIWNLVNTLCGRKGRRKKAVEELTRVDGIISDRAEIASVLNHNFCNMAMRLVSSRYGTGDKGFKFDIARNNSTIAGAPIEAFTFQELCPYDIITKAKVIKANMGGCKNSCPGSIYKKYIVLFANELALLFNQCLRQGICPQELKFTTITPIYKKGPRTDPGNYRPISCVPFLAKLLESFINDQIVAYLTVINFIHPMQFGFRKGCCTTLALSHMYKIITAAWEKKESVLAIFIDVEKAFDSLDRGILLNILRQINFSKDVLEFFKSYFKSRIQVTINGDSMSGRCVSSIGIPQGTSLSPTLFLIYINSLLVTCQTESICFADDVTLLYKLRRDSFDSDVKQINQKLGLVERWYREHRLCVNANKTKMIVFHPRQRVLTREPLITFGGQHLSSTSEHRCLGVTWDSTLSFRGHIETIIEQLRSIVPAIARLANITVPRYALLAIYKGLFLAYIRYCIIIYGNASDVHLNKLQVIQNSAVRAVFQHYDRQGVTQLYNSHRLLKIKHLYRYELGILAYKNFCERLPCDVAFYFTKNTNALNNSRPYRTPQVRHDYRIRSPDIAILNLWNSLDAAIRNANNLRAFKRMWREKVLSEQLNA